MEDIGSAMQVLLERIQPLVIPARQQLRFGAGHPGDMDVDGPRLADSVEPSDALLEQLRVGRQIEEHQVVGKLEVPPLAADLRADQ